MASFQETAFHDMPVNVDGNSYKSCTFGPNVILVYSGGDVPGMEHCRIHPPARWEFEDAAQRTLTQLRNIYHGYGDWGKQVIDETFEKIRQPLSAGDWRRTFPDQD